MRPGSRTPRHRRRALRGALVVLLAGCGRAPEPGSALLITLDTTRPDALSCFGGPAGLTPHIDRLAARAVAFDRAYTVAPLTLPAHASMLTGLLPPQHTVRENGLWPLPESAETLAERAQDAGFATAAAVGALVLDAPFGLAQGFATYTTPGRRAGSATSRAVERPAAAVIDDALAFLERREPARPFFLWVHLFDPHGPYQPPAGFAPTADLVGQYHGEVAAADQEIGRLLDALERQGLFDGMTVLLVADHGEAFGEHGEMTHGMYCYDTTLRVPLLLKPAGAARAGTRDARLASVADVFPTLLEGMGLAVPAGLPGRSLLAPAAADGGAYFECYSPYLSYGWSPIAGLVGAGGKYIHSSEPQFFDLAEDPGEEQDRLAERRDLAARHARRIAALTAAPALPHGAEDTAISEELREAVREVGYLAAGAESSRLPGPLEDTGRLAPRRTGELYRAVLAGQELVNAGRYDQAERLLRQVLERDPGNYFALDKLAVALMHQGRNAEALPLLVKLLDGGPQLPGSHYNLALCLLDAGRTAEALHHLEEAVRRAPHEPLFARTLEETRAARGSGSAPPPPRGP